METMDMLDCTSVEYVDRCTAMDLPAAMALSQYRSAYRLGSTDVTLRRIERVQREGGTTKFTVSHGEAVSAETVIIPQMRSDGTRRTTLCVSSQIGCAMGCTFCQTAQLGLLKHLGARDVVEQWYIARHHFGAPIDNVVFMGMGEPMDNLDQVLRAIEILTDRNGAAIAAAHITVSTVGRCAGIERYIDFAKRPGYRGLKLAVSINAPNDAIRRQIMPITRAEPMHRLMEAMQKWPRRVLIEYVLIPGVNDAVEHADKLAQYLQPLPCTVNLIAYNPRRDSPWPAPAPQKVDAFAQRLSGHGLRVICRRTTGRSVMAACGQLGGASQPRKSFLESFSG